MPAMAVSLHAKVAIVTGAGSGIGRASALHFARAGARVVVGDIDEEALERLVSEAGAKHEGLLACVADVTRPESNHALVRAATERFGGCDVFFANAGGATATPLEQLPEHDYHALIALNLDSVWHGFRAALPAFRARRGGSFVATASGAAHGAVPGLAAYGAAKAGLIALVRSIAQEHGAEGIRANALSPGPVESPALLAYLEGLPGGRRAYEAGLPLRRLGRAEEVARVAAFLASDEASYVSGACLPVDGGIHGALWQPSSAPETAGPD